MFIIMMLFFNSLIHLPTPFIGTMFYDVKQCDSLLFFSTVRGMEIYRWDLVNPQLISRSSTVGLAVAVDISGNYAYVADHYNGLVIYDITNPAAPAQIGNYDTDGLAWDVSIAGNYAYVADNNNGLVVLDISNPANPLLIGHCPNNDINQSVTLSDTFALMGSYDGPMKLINIADPANPYILSRFPDESDSDFGWDACIEDTLVYLNGMKWLPQGMPYRFMIYSIAVPTNPRLISGFHIDNGTNRGIVKIDNVICTNGQDGRVFIIDVTDPLAPYLINYYTENHYFGPSLALCDTFLIAPHSREGFSILNLANPYHIIPTYRHANNIIWSDFIADESHNNMFAIGRIFCNSGWESYSTLKIADISNPGNPVVYSGYNFSGKADIYENSFDYPYLAVTIARGFAGPYYTALMNLLNPSDPTLERFVEGGGITGMHLPHVYSLQDNKIKIADIYNPDFWVDSILLPASGHYIIISDTLAFIAIDNSLLILNITTGNMISTYYHGRPFAYKMSLCYPHLAIAYIPNFFNFGFLIFDVSDPAAPALLHEEVISVPNWDPSYCIVGCHLEDTLLFIGLADFGFDIWKIKLPDSVYRILRQDTPQNATTDPYGNTGIFFMNDVIYIKDESCIELYKWTETGLEAFSKNDLRTQLDYISAYPNPAHHTVNFKLQIADLSLNHEVSIKIYNAAGELVRFIIPPTSASSPSSTIIWDGMDDNENPVPQGLYFAKLANGLESHATKVILVK